MRRAASLSEQPESTKAKARRRRSSSRSALPFGLAIGVQAEKQSTYIIGFFLEESYYILYTLLNNRMIRELGLLGYRVEPLEHLQGTEPHEIDRLFFGHCRMEPAWDRFDFAVGISDVYEQKMAAIRVYESVFSGDQASLLDKYDAEDRYIGSLVGVQYAEAFRARSPLLVDSPEIFRKARFG